MGKRYENYKRSNLYESLPWRGTFPLIKEEIGEYKLGKAMKRTAPIQKSHKNASDTPQTTGASTWKPGLRRGSPEWVQQNMNNSNGS